MRRGMVGALVVLMLGLATGADAPDPGVLAPIRKFVDSFNKGDAAAAAATHVATADLAIIDEVPPYTWRGTQAFQDWSAALESDTKKHGATNQVVTLGVPIRQETEGDRAYVVVPAVLNFKERGVAMREAAQMTFALKKGTDGWLIQAWAWTGPRPEPQPPAKP